MIKTLKEFINLFKKDIKLKWTCQQYSDIMDNHDDDIFDLTFNLGNYDGCSDFCRSNTTTSSSNLSTINIYNTDFKIKNENNLTDFLTKRFLERN